MRPSTEPLRPSNVPNDRPFKEDEFGNLSVCDCLQLFALFPRLVLSGEMWVLGWAPPGGTALRRGGALVGPGAAPRARRRSPQFVLLQPIQRVRMHAARARAAPRPGGNPLRKRALKVRQTRVFTGIHGYTRVYTGIHG
eukprot:1998803-Pyramimonas_sp.AAC.1